MQFRTDRAAGPKRQLTGIAVIVSLIGLSVPAAAQNGLSERHGRLFPPVDLGLLEGPDRAAWQKPDQIMDALAIADGSAVADIGAGAGWFTIHLARRVGPNGLHPDCSLTAGKHVLKPVCIFGHEVALHER